jgi:hypothetical protein
MYHYLHNTPIPEYELETIQIFHHYSFLKNNYIWESKNQFYSFKDMKYFLKKTFLLNSFYLECFHITLIQVGWPGCQNDMWSKVNIFWFPGKIAHHFIPGCIIKGSYCEIISTKRQTTHYFIQHFELVKKSLLNSST